MPFTYDVEPDGLIVVVGSGDGDRQQWLATLFQLMSDERFRSNAPILMDCSQITSAPPPIYISALTDDVRSLLQEHRIAVVATLQAVTLLASQISLLTGGRLAVFASADAARLWLNKRDGEQDPVTSGS